MNRMSWFLLGHRGSWLVERDVTDVDETQLNQSVTSRLTNQATSMTL